ncbi:MAG: ClbS/DfsB family four-helix bundle protein [Clostridiales bacterium]|jgi:hypothetical protein|nr:ClbS/DfsB family four-helix bundle protein [Clostridiales bacterium]
MARPTSKTDLLTAAHMNFEKLNELIASMSETELNTPSKKNGGWRKCSRRISIV